MSASPGPGDRLERIVLLRALGLGDFLTGIPAYRAVRRAFPDAEITLAAPAGLRPLAELTGAVDRLLPAGELQPVPWPFAPPDLAIDLHGRGPRSRRLLAELRPRRLIGFHAGDGDFATGPPCRWRPDEHEVHRWCRLLAAHGIPADPDDLDLARPGTGPDSPLRSASGSVVIHPGAAAPARRWPADRFAAVAAVLHRRGHRVVITGGAAERPLALEVARRAGLCPAAVLAGATTLTDLARLVADAALVISGDTGTAHLATAYRRPSVVLFGPVPPAEWGPPPGRRRHIALHAAKPGYRGDPHGATLDPALDAISVGDVLRAVRGVESADRSTDGG
ncbi:MAG: glycosyltransferase family 9 protein [Catenulispora sp.]